MVVGCQPFAGESMRWIKDTVSGLANPHDAAARNRVSKMEKYLMQGGDVNKPNKLGDIPLHEACAYIRDNGDSSKNRRRKAAVKDRRKIGKRLSRRQMGESGPLEMLELLLKAGSDINAQNIVGDAPLHKAAMNGRARAADYLICSGANVNIRNEFDQTPLHFACVSGNIEVVQRLVQGGADTSAQDAAEDTPFHEACRHQFEGIVIYLMGLVNNPDTSQALKLWRGLDPSWEQVLRSRAQARVDDDEALGGKRVEVTAGASAGLSSVRLGVSTPSTTHNSLRSSESAMGLGLANRTPVGRGQVAANGSRDRGSGGGGVTVSVRGSNRERKKTSSPGTPRARGGGHPRARNRSSESPAAAGAGLGADGADLYSTSVSRTDSATRRRRRDRGGGSAAEGSSRRPFTADADADAVLDWQATKVKSVEQGKVIEKARMALREEQQEQAMAMSTTTQGDDDCSVDTMNTADTPTNAGSRIGRAPDQRKDGDGQASPAATAAKMRTSDFDAESTPGLKRVETSTRRTTAAAAAAAAASVSQGDAKQARASGGSPGMPTPPHTGVKDLRQHVPPREVGRRQSARKSKGQAIPLRSPIAQLSRRASGSGFPKYDDAQESSSRRPSRRSSGSRSGSDRRTSAAAGPAEGGHDADGSRRSTGARPSRSSGDAASPRRVSPSNAAAMPSARPRRRSSRETDRDRRGEGAGGEGRGERRTTSSRREKVRRREGETAPAPRASPREGGRSSRRRRQSSRGEGGGSASGAAAGGGDGSRRTREPRRSSRGSDNQGANGSLPTAAASPSPAPGRPALMVEVTEAAAVAVAIGDQRASTAVAQAGKAPHVTRTPRPGDSLSAHFMTHGTASRTEEERRTPSKATEGGVSPSRNSGARERRTANSSRISEGRPSAMAPKQRSSGQDLRPPTWASDITSELVIAAPRKKVIASDFPVKRISPYSVRRSRTLDACGSPDRVSAAHHFSSNPSARKPEGPAARGNPPLASAAPLSPSSPSFEKREAPAARGSPAHVSANPEAPSRSGFKKPEASAACGSPSRSSAGPQVSSSPSVRQSEVAAASGSPARASAAFGTASPSSLRRPEARGSLGRLSADPRTPSPPGDREPRCLSASGSPAPTSTGPRNSSPSHRPALVPASRPVAKAMDVRDDSESDSAALAAATAVIEADASPLAKGSCAAGAAVEPRSHRSPSESSAEGREDDVPPLIHALMMDKEAAEGVPSTLASEQLVRENMNDGLGSPTSPTPGTTRKSFQTKAMVLAKSKSVLFSDSGTDSEDGRCSAVEALQHSSRVDAKLIAALSAVSKAFLQSREEGVAGDAASSCGSSPKMANEAATSAVAEDSKAASEGSTPATQALTPPQPQPPPPPPVAAVATAAVPVVETSASSAVADDRVASIVEAPKASSVLKALSVDGRVRAAVEPSAAPRITLKASPPTASMPFSTKAAPAPALSAMVALPGTQRAVLGGGARGRSSALGRPGTAPAKVTMPIAGGRAAWNKFLATTTPEEPEQGQEGTSAGITSSADARGRDEDGDTSAQKDESPGEEEHAPVVPERAPRGFKSAADAQEGSNKGPAGAFSGNAMWRLAGNTTSAASRARSGIAANGHGGYSNPLAVMRAAGNGAASGTGVAGAPGGAAMVNPLAGLRGAAGMGGAGIANPLARGRGRRPGGAGGTANPMLRGGGVGGGGTASNPLARGPAGGGAVLSSSSGPSVAASRGGLRGQTKRGEGSGGEGAPVSTPPLPSGDKESTATGPDGGERSTAAPPLSVGSPPPAGAVGGGPGHEADAVDPFESKGPTTGEPRQEDGPVEFRAIGSNGSWQRDRMVIPPRRPVSAPRHAKADRDPGQAKVGGLVMALQTPGESSHVGLATQDPSFAKVSSPSSSSLSVLGEQGLVRLRRIKYSPRHSAPAASSSANNIFDTWANDPGSRRRGTDS